MRLFFFFYLVFLTLSTNAQLIRGKVIDRQSGKPLSNIIIKMRYSQTASGPNGEFMIIPSKQDTIYFSGFGYATYPLIYRDDNPKEVLIQMVESGINLDEVAIFSKRNHKADSLQLRKEYAKEFNYKPPGLKSIFVPVSPGQKRMPFEFVSLNLGGVISLLTQKYSKASKFKKRLLKDESLSYIDSRFSQDRIVQLTKLSGDSLYLFIEKYQPQKETLISWSDYELMTYIKSSYKEFKDYR